MEKKKSLSQQASPPVHWLVRKEGYKRNTADFMMSPESEKQSSPILAFSAFYGLVAF